jgi:acetyl/propionyl-CoA carboxylase alpha subunit
MIVTGPTFDAALARAERALASFRLEGAPSNIGFLRALLADKDVRTDKVHTRFVDEHAKKLIAAAAKLEGGRYFQAATTPLSTSRQVGARVDAVDPLAVLSSGRGRRAGARADAGYDR